MCIIKNTKPSKPGVKEIYIIKKQNITSILPKVGDSDDEGTITSININPGESLYKLSIHKNKCNFYNILNGIQEEEFAGCPITKARFFSTLIQIKLKKEETINYDLFSEKYTAFVVLNSGLIYVLGERRGLIAYSNIPFMLLENAYFPMREIDKNLFDSLPKS